MNSRLMRSVCILALAFASADLAAQCIDHSLDDILPDIYEQDDSPELAGTIPVEGPADPTCQNRSVAPAGDQDWILLQALANTAYEVDVTNYSAGLAPRVTIVDQDGATSLLPQPITTNLCGQPGTIVCFSFRLANFVPARPDGIYYLLVDAPDSGMTGNYNIRVWTPEAGPSVLFTGTVQDSQKNPIGGANIVALSNGTVLATAGVPTKASQGYVYAMSVPNPSTFKVVATASGYSQAMSANQNVDDPSPNPAPVTVNLTMAALASAPVATALSATGTSPASANLRGSVQTNGAATTVSFGFRQGNSGSFAIVSGSQQSLSNSASAQSVSAQVASLTCGGVSYQFEVNASNNMGPVSSSPINFQTEACAVPNVTAQQPSMTCSPPSSCSVTFSANVSNANPPTTAELQYRLAAAAGWNTVGLATSAAGSFVDSSTQMGLRCGSNYKFQALAQPQGANAWVVSNSVAFSTSACPAPTVSGLKAESSNYGVCTGVDIADFAVASTLNVFLQRDSNPPSNALQAPTPANTTTVHKNLFFSGLGCGATDTVTYEISNQYGTTSKSTMVTLPACVDTIFPNGFDTPVVCVL